VFHSIKEQAQTGLVGGRGQGTGVVQVKRVEFDGTFSSLYNFEKHHVTQRGDSVSDFQAAGFNKSGKYSAGELKFKRNIEKDRGAVKRYASAIGSQIQQEIRPKLPSLMVLQQIEASNMAAGAGDVTLQDAADRFKKLLGR
jgi:hypothetical protein